MPTGAAATALLADPKHPGAMWAAFNGRGVFYWDGTSWRNIDHGQAMAGDRIVVLAAGPSGSIWIGSEVGLSRLDAIGFETFDARDGVQNGAVYAVAQDAQGAYWFGGQKGLSYYRPEQTPPKLDLGDVNSVGGQPLLDAWQVLAERPVHVSLRAGDLQGQPEGLHYLYRLMGNDAAAPWQEAAGNPIELTFHDTGAQEAQFMVRDTAFNYSPPVSQRFRVLPPPAILNLPFFGEIEQRIFQLLLIFGSVTVVGFSYVIYEVTHHRRRVTEAIKRGYNPYISGEPVRREDMFFGRHELLERIVGTLHNNSIMIHGERRIGKTTLLYQLAKVLRQVVDAEYWFVPVFIDLEGTTEQRLFHLLIEEITQGVGALPDLSADERGILDDLIFQRPDVDAYTDREFSRDLRAIIRLVEEYGGHHAPGRNVRLILLMDEMDTLSNFDHLYQQQLRRIFMRDFASTVGAVVAGIQISKEWDRVESPWFNLFNEIAIPTFTDAQAKELLVEPVRGYYIFDPDALVFIITNSDGRPFRLQQYALEAVNHMLEARRRRITLADVLAAHEVVRLATEAGHGEAGLGELKPTAQSERATLAVQTTAQPGSAVLPVGKQQTPPPGMAALIGVSKDL